MTRRAGVLMLAVGVLGGYLGLSQACPTVAVVIPETVITRIPRPIPDPAAETAIIERFLSYGFNVVDLVHIKLLRATSDGLAMTRDLARAGGIVIPYEVPVICITKDLCIPLPDMPTFMEVATAVVAVAVVLYMQIVGR